jgi:hypothetical protein
MTILEANDQYIATCGDKYVMEHWFNFRQDLLGESVLLNWLLQRMATDTKPLVNLDGSIALGINQPDDTEQFIATWVDLLK